MPVRGAGRQAPALLLALCLSGGTALAQPFTLQAFDEWIVACDNLGRCSALNMGPSAAARSRAAPAAQPSRICIHHAGGTVREPTIHLTLARDARQGAAAQARLLRVVGPAETSPDVPLIPRSPEHWQVPPGSVPRILGALLDGGEAQLLAAGGRVLERIAIEGINAAMDVSHAWQERPRTAWPEAVLTAPLPLLSAGRAPSAQSIALGQAACAASSPDAWTGHGLIGNQLRPDRVLWQARCEASGGLQRAFFVIEEQDGSSAPVAFADRGGIDGVAAEGMIDHPDFEPARGLLHETWHAVSRPSSGEPCMVHRLWGWTGQGFERLVERRSLACMGDGGVWLAVTYSRPFGMPALGFVPPAASPFAPPCGGLLP